MVSMVKANRSSALISCCALSSQLCFSAATTLKRRLYKFSTPALRMDLNSIRRVSSAGYRLPERKPRPVSAQPAAERSRRVTRREPPPAEPSSDKGDSVKQDQVWKDLVWNERRAVEEWEENWGFLRNYDQLGQLKSEEPSPTPLSFFSERLPNTSNQTIGSRLCTPLGGEVVKLDRLMLWSGRHHRRKLDPETLPC